MAILNKPDIQVLIDAYTVKVDSVIVANGNKDITGPILNDVFQDTIEILTDIKDSYYNLLSETRTAASTSYDSTATTSFWDLPIPTNSQEAHDQEIERIANLEGFPPSNIAYVSDTTGNDTFAELGNPLRPFKTIQAGVDGIGSTAGKVIVEPGNYPQQNILAQNKTQLTLIMDGVTANIPNFRFDGGSGGFKFLSMRNAVITSFVRFRMDYTTVKGGRVNLNFSGNNGVADINNSYIEDLIIVNIAGPALEGGGNSFFSKCFFQSSSIAIRRTVDNTFQNCTVFGANCYEDLNSTTTSFQNCKLISTGTTLIGANNVVLGTFENCVIESTGSNNMSFTGNSTSFYALNCRFKALTDNIVIINDLLNRTIDQQTTFEGCRFNAGTGEVLVEPVSYTLDQGTTLFLDCKINKVALTGVASIRVTDNNTYSNINLQYFG